jgi:hypothetical protein
LGPELPVHGPVGPELLQFPLHGPLSPLAKAGLVLNIVTAGNQYTDVTRTDMAMMPEHLTAQFFKTLIIIYSWD